MMIRMGSIDHRRRFGIRCPFWVSGKMPKTAAASLFSLGLDSPFFSTMVLFKNPPFSPRFWKFSRKKDPWKEWGR